MAGTRIYIDAGEALEDIGVIAEKLADLTEPFEDWGEYLLGELQERFDLEEDPEGNKWADLADATKAKKRIDKILTESSRLRDANVYEATAKTLRIGNNVVYGAIHQLGGVAGRDVEITARPYLGIRDVDIEEFQEIMGDYLNG